MLGHRTLNLEDYVTILKRRWWIVAIPALIFTVLAYGATYWITPQYTSSSTVLVDQQKVPTDFVKSLATEALDTRLAYISAKILSRTSILPIIEHYNLYADQHLTPDARIDLAKKALHIQAVESALAASNGLPGFQISFSASDPHTAQQVCAEITSLFTKDNVDFRNGQAEDTNSFLQERLADAKRTLDDQDKKVADFQRQYFGMLPEDQSSNENIMSSLSSRLEATTQTINNLQGNKSIGETMLAQQTESTPTSVAAAKLPQAHEAELEQLETQEAALTAQYQPDYPDVKEVKRKIADLKAEMARDAAAPAIVAPSAAPVKHADSSGVIQLRAQLHGIDLELAQKQKEQDDIKRQIQGYEGKIQSSPLIEEQFKELTRDYQTDQASYDSLLKELNQADATTDLEHRQEGESFTLLDEANLPLEPIFPKVPVFIFGGLFGGIVVGLLIVALLEYKDTALRTEREIWDFTHLPTLAVIAWSGETAEATSVKKGRLKRMFGRKPPNDLIAGARG
jgi:polysaccharide chain length determinant protein (PEP-CTERM system associated)